MWKSRSKNWGDEETYEKVMATLILYAMQNLNKRRTELYVGSILPADATKHYRAYRNALLGKDEMEEIKQAVETANLLKQVSTSNNSNIGNRGRGFFRSQNYRGRGRGRGQTNTNNYNPFTPVTGTNGASQDA